MAINVNELGMRQEGNGNLPGGQDVRVMQRSVVIVGAAMLVLVAIKLGFLQRVLP